jgi:proton glutamate symport protein
MSQPSNPATGSRGDAAKPRFRFSITQQILLGLALGCLLGWWMSHMPEATRRTCEVWVIVVRDIFLHLIKAMIAPLIFASVVQGIAGAGDIK